MPIVPAKVPPELYLGRIDGQWPIEVFTEKSHAASWLAEGHFGRRVWKVAVAVLSEMELVPPTPPDLREKTE